MAKLIRLTHRMDNAPIAINVDLVTSVTANSIGQAVFALGTGDNREVITVNALYSDIIDFIAEHVRG